jgi:hypothetical protein
MASQIVTADLHARFWKFNKGACSTGSHHPRHCLHDRDADKNLSDAADTLALAFADAAGSAGYNDLKDVLGANQPRSLPWTWVESFRSSTLVFKRFQSTSSGGVRSTHVKLVAMLVPLVAAYRAPLIEAQITPNPLSGSFDD